MKDLELEFTAQYSESNDLMVTPFSGSIKIYPEPEVLNQT